MPHGVLFRGGEEKAARKKIIEQGILEAVIGMPSGLFYGTGIPACVLVINKQGASQRDSIVFINADREYKEGKNQNQLRPEDIEKITYVYRNKIDVDKYSRNVPIAELREEDFNLNIRRYVDNSPPPEPHDVRAHLNGGIPVVEINTLENYFNNYQGIKDQLFTERDAVYSDFNGAISQKDQIKQLIEEHAGVKAKHEQYEAALLGWWQKNVDQLEALPGKNVFALRRSFLKSIVDVLLQHNMLDVHKVQGACASYLDVIATDLKSVAASGWGAELIPEEDILASQFPEILEQLEQDKSRILELEGLFAAGDTDDEDAESDDLEESETGVLPKLLVKSFKEQIKDLKGELKSINADLKAVTQDIKRARTSGMYAADLKILTDKERLLSKQVASIKQEIAEIESKLEKHSELDKELKTLKANIRESEKKKDVLVEKARERITEEDAKELILERFRKLLLTEYQGYLRQYRQGFVAKVENLWSKYSVTVKVILAERDKEAELLNQYLVELGYE
jgi:type I restriction enzyme M protein